MRRPSSKQAAFGAEVDSAFTGKLIIGAIIILLAASTWWRVSIWNECRSSHSAPYCIQMMGR